MFWLPWAGAAVCGLSLAAGRRAYPLALVYGFPCSSSAWGTEQALEHMGFSSCDTWAQLWCMGLAASGHTESSQTKDQTCVLCIGRRILNHWTIKEVLILISGGYFHFIKSLSCRMSLCGTYFFTWSHPQYYLSLWYVTLCCFAFFKKSVDIHSGCFWDVIFLGFKYHVQCYCEHLHIRHL